jgi:hypothetical protein
MNLKQVRRSSSSRWLIVLATVFAVVAGVSLAGAFAKLADPGAQEKKEDKKDEKKDDKKEKKGLPLKPDRKIEFTTDEGT